MKKFNSIPPEKIQIALDVLATLSREADSLNDTICIDRVSCIISYRTGLFGSVIEPDPTMATKVIPNPSIEWMTESGKPFPASKEQ